MKIEINGLLAGAFVAAAEAEWEVDAEWEAAVAEAAAAREASAREAAIAG